MTGGWYTSGSAREGAGGGGCGDGSGVGVAGASGAGGGAGVVAGTPAPAQRTAAVPVSAPNDAGTPAPVEGTAQVQGKAPGPRVAQRETPEVVPVRRENLQEKDRQVTVAGPPG